MVACPQTGLFLLGYSNHQKACASCTMAESGASNVISALSMLKNVKQYSHYAQFWRYVYVHVAQWSL